MKILCPQGSEPYIALYRTARGGIGRGVWVTTGNDENKISIRP